MILPLAAVAVALLAVSIGLLLKWRGESVRRSGLEQQLQRYAAIIDGESVRRSGLEQQLQRYAAIIDVEAHVANVHAEMAKLTAERDQFNATDRQRRSELNANYQTALGTYERLRRELNLLEENLEDMSSGLYKPHYNFETSERFKTELDRIYEQKRTMIRLGTAAICEVNWTVGNSERDGKSMVKQHARSV